MYGQCSYFSKRETSCYLAHKGALYRYILAMPSNVVIHPYANLTGFPSIGTLASANGFWRLSVPFWNAALSQS